MGFLLRWLAAFFLLAATYNPTEWSYVQWAFGHWHSQTPLVILFGLLLLVVYVLFLTAVYRGIGTPGVVLIVAVLSAFFWVLYDFGWLDLENPTVNRWIVILALSIVFALGMYWGILWRRISGQLEVDDDGQG